MINICASEYTNFLINRNKNLRFGQAFFHHFKLHKMDKTDRPWLDELFEADGDDAIAIIKQQFDIE